MHLGNLGYKLQRTLFLMKDSAKDSTIHKYSSIVSRPFLNHQSKVDPNLLILFVIFVKVNGQILNPFKVITQDRRTYSSLNVLRCAYVTITLRLRCDYVAITLRLRDNKVSGLSCYHSYQKHSPIEVIFLIALLCVVSILTLSRIKT